MLVVPARGCARDGRGFFLVGRGPAALRIEEAARDGRVFHRGAAVDRAGGRAEVRHAGEPAQVAGEPNAVVHEDSESGEAGEHLTFGGVVERG